MTGIFDTHAHYDDEAYDEDREVFVASLLDNNVTRVVNIGADIKSSGNSVALSKKYDFFYAAIGVHPSDVAELEEEGALDALKAMVTENEKIVAIGEIGLDYHYDDTDRELQKKWFEKQLELAREVKLPVVIHSRDAAKDTIDIMKAHDAEEIGGVIHCYSYEKEMAKLFLRMGYFFGIGGVLTFKNSRKLKEVVEYLPLENIVLETDAPYLAPVPYRGKRNSSSYIKYVAEEIANIKNIDVDEVLEKTFENACRLYKLYV